MALDVAVTSGIAGSERTFSLLSASMPSGAWACIIHEGICVFYMIYGETELLAEKIHFAKKIYVAIYYQKTCMFHITVNMFVNMKYLVFFLCEFSCDLCEFSCDLDYCVVV